MKKIIYAILAGLGLLAGGFIVASAITCTNVFPISLNGYTSGACIPSAWGNALEAKLGITGSTATSSLDYQINHIFTSYGSEIVKATSTQGLLQTANNLSDLTSTSSARTNIGFTAGSGINISATGTIGNTGVLSLASSTGSGGINMSASTGSGIYAGLASLNISQFTNDSSYATTGYVGAEALLKTNNLSDLTSTSSARSNIGFSAGTGVTISGTGVIAASGLLAASTTPTPAYSPISNASGTLADGWIGQSASDTYNFLGSVTSASTTLNGTTTFNGTVSGSLQLSNGSSSAGTLIVYTDATSSFTIPSYVNKITINALGAGGSASVNSGGALGAGGTGGSATGSLSVSSGTTYYYCIGGTAGFCGGGNGQSNGGSGGGMTWFGTASSFSTSSVVIVGGGGGGGGESNGTAGTNPNGGVGGLTTGGTGVTGQSSTAGTGGTQSAGGTGGSSSGTAGSAGQGGVGGNNIYNTGGGGGGGGYYGGGGGGAPSSGSNIGSGGGGGSSYLLSTMTATSTASTTNATNGALSIYYTGVILPQVGIIQMGNYSTNLPITITFTKAFTITPSCSVIPSTNTQAWVSAESTSSFTFNLATTTANMFVNYQCF